MFSAISWLDDHRHEINVHYSKIAVSFFRHASQHENDVWWTLNAATKNLTSAIHTMMIRFQVHRMTLNQQQINVQQFIDELMLTIMASRNFNVENLDDFIHVICND